MLWTNSDIAIRKVTLLQQSLQCFSLSINEGCSVPSSIRYDVAVVQLLSSVRLFSAPWTAVHCPSLSPGVCSNTCPLGQWCYLTMSFPAAPFSSCLQSLPALESLPVSQLFESGGQIIGVLASTLVLPMNTQDWSPLGWSPCSWISLQFKDPQKSFPRQIKESLIG